VAERRRTGGDEAGPFAQRGSLSPSTCNSLSGGLRAAASRLPELATLLLYAAVGVSASPEAPSAIGQMNTTTYHFEYEPLQRGGSLHRRREAKAIGAARRATGIVFLDQTGPGAYFFDLRTRQPIGARVKRAMDVVMALFFIVMLAPVLIAVALAVKLTSKGPLIFRQRRIGFRCNQFEMYKFRSMYAGAELKEKELAEQSGASFLKLKNDPRITPVGAFIRKYSLDELPQLFNVLEGTMSMVGPRPLLVSDLDKLPRRNQLRRFATPPGITGLWQVSGRSNCSDLKRMQLDRRYVDRWSLGLDLRILLETVEVVLTAKGAV
jgi:lipopolysaccharide/colanic/teichoic acid biosynthesis glycosyltransferase